MTKYSKLFLITKEIWIWGFPPIRLTESWVILIVGRMWGHGNPYTSLVGARTGTAILEGSLIFLVKLHKCTHHVPSNSAPRESLTEGTRGMYEDAPCSFIWGRGELSATPVSITERRKRSPVVGASTGHCTVVRGTRLEIHLATWMDHKNKVVKKKRESTCWL